MVFAPLNQSADTLKTYRIHCRICSSSSENKKVFFIFRNCNKTNEKRITSPPRVKMIILASLCKANFLRTNASEV